MSLPELYRKEEHGRIVINDEGLEYVCKAAADGVPRTAIAASLRINRRTLREITQRQPEVAEAFAAGRAGNEAELVSLLMEQARSGNMVATMFLLKSMHGYREGEARENDSRPTVIINLPDSMTPEQYTKMIEQ